MFLGVGTKNTINFFMHIDNFLYDAYTEHIENYLYSWHRTGGGGIKCQRVMKQSAILFKFLKL